MSLNVNEIRSEFPSLKENFGGKPAIFFDNPGGTQVPFKVIESIKEYLTRKNSNTHGVFETSIKTDMTIDAAHRAGADLLGAEPEEIVFGQNMTTLTFNLSRSLAKEIKEGDEIIVTRLDHDANISPWLMISEERGAKIVWVDVNPEDCTLDMNDLKKKINERTKIIAFCYASNAVGTVNDVKTIVKWAKEVDALTYVDAVQYAPHNLIDVKELDCDFLVCSSYKFFGPHLGILYGKREHLEGLRAYKARPVPEILPEKWETGTLNHEGMEGFIAAVDYIAEIGVKYGGIRKESSKRERIKRAFELIREYESKLAETFIERALSIKNLRIYGIKDKKKFSDRVPVFSIRKDGVSPDEMAKIFASENIFCWSGHFFAIEIVRRLRLENKGGLLRVGFVHYNIIEEIEKFFTILEKI